LRSYRECVRTVDLALYADVLAVKAARVAARLERARGELRQAAIEREIRHALDAATVARLERLRALGQAEPRSLRDEVVELAADLAALEELQAWVEARLADAREEGSSPGARDFGVNVRRSTVGSRLAGREEVV
jgi:hypothetical protein